MANTLFTLSIVLILLTAPLVANAAGNPNTKVAAAKPAPKQQYVHVRQWSVGLGYWSWTEALEMTSQGLRDSDYANYKADVLSLGFRSFKGAWGYEGGLMYMMGHASAGGNSTVIDYRSQRAWTGYGAQVGGFYRWIRQIEVGLQVPAIWRDPKWPTPAGSTVQGEAETIITGMAFWRVIPLDSFFFETGIGPMGMAGQTIWKLNVQYVF